MTETKTLLLTHFWGCRRGEKAADILSSATNFLGHLRQVPESFWRRLTASLVPPDVALTPPCVVIVQGRMSLNARGESHLLSVLEGVSPLRGKPGTPQAEWQAACSSLVGNACV